MKISLRESIERDDPTKYFYKVQILEEDKSVAKENPPSEKVNGDVLKPERRESGRMKEKMIERNKTEKSLESTEYKAKWSGSLMEVQCNVMS